MTHELSPGKSICILGIVIGCFAILWPNVFYPMLKGSNSASVDTAGIRCCSDLLSEKEVYDGKLTVKSTGDIVTSIASVEKKFSHCRHSFKHNRFSHLPRRTIVTRIRNSTSNTFRCGTPKRIERPLLQHEIRSSSRSLPAEQLLESVFTRHFVDAQRLAQSTDDRITISSKRQLQLSSRLNCIGEYTRPERSQFSRPPNTLPPEVDNSVLPQSSMRIPLPSSPSLLPVHERESTSSRIMSAKKPPINGIRPPFMGGVSHPVISQKGNGSMNVLMPLYTIGIVVFFGYTILKLMCKKQETASNYGGRDAEFCRYVFNENGPHECTLHAKAAGCINASNVGIRRPMTNKSSELVVSAISSLLEEVNRDILKRETSNASDEENAIRRSRTNEDEDHVDTDAPILEDDQQSCRTREMEKMSKESSEFVKRTADRPSSSPADKKINGSVRVMGIDVNQSSDTNGSPQQQQRRRRWRRLPRHASSSESGSSNDSDDGSRAPIKEAGHREVVVLERSVPENSRILVSDAHTENLAPVAESSSEVLVRSKMTLNVIANIVDENQHTSSCTETTKTSVQVIDGSEEEEEEEDDYENEIEALNIVDRSNALSCQRVPGSGENKFDGSIENDE